MLLGWALGSTVVCNADNDAARNGGQVDEKTNGTAAWIRAPREIRFDIPAQDLADALIQLGEQADLSVMVHQDVIGIGTPGLRGDFTVVDALGRILADTGLEYRPKGDAIIVSRPLARLTRRAEPQKQSVLRRVGAAVAATVLAITGTGATAAAEDGPQDAEAADERDREVETIVVTGSRIGLPPSQISSPVIVLDAEALFETGEANLERALARLPQNFAGGTELGGGARLGFSFDEQQFNGTQNVFGASTANLRGVGERGTLILVNGKRMGSSGLLGGYSDISSIPMELVERVEIQLDGASALYGSDAIGGVINIILRRDYEGTTVRVRQTAPLKGGYERYNASVATTKAWSSGSITGSLTYYRSTIQTVAEDSSLDAFFATYDLFTPAGTVRGENGAPIEAVSSLLGEDVLVASIPPGQDGTRLTPADFVATANNPTMADPNRRHRTLTPARDRLTLRAELNQELPGETTLSTSVSYTPNESLTTTGYGSLRFNVEDDNPFNPFGQDVDVLRSTTDFPAREITGNNDRWRWTGDLEGSFGDILPNWSWTLGATRTWEDAESVTTNEFGGRVVEDALDDGLLNVFGQSLAGSNPPDLLASFVLPPQTFDTRNEDTGLEATGKAEFEFLPAGKTKILVGASHRRNELSYAHQRHDRARYSPVTSGAGLGVFPRDTSMIGNEDVDLSGVEGAVIVDNDNARLSSSMSVESVFAELQVPLLADLPLIHRVSVNAALRHENTSLYGSDTTWSIGGVWNVAPEFRLRWRRGTSFSAPTLKQSTLPTRVRPIPLFFDQRGGGFRILCFPFPPCSATIIEGGKSSLLPETSVTLSYGMEYEPRFLPGFRASVNYSELDYRNKIDAQTGLIATLIPLFVDLELDLPRYRYIYRFDDDGEFLGIDGRASNIGTLYLASYDLALDYERETSFGNWAFRVSSTVQDTYESRLGPGEEATDHIGLNYGVPKFRQHVRLRWSRGNLRATLNASHQQDTANDARYFRDGVWYDYRSTLKQPVVLDLALAYEFANGILGVVEGMRVNFGLSNLTNKHTTRRETLADGQPLPRSQDDLVRIPQGRYDSRSRVYYVEFVHTFR